MNIIVTGGAGFIGSALIREAVNSGSFNVLNIDKLTYAANQDSLSSIAESSNYTFKQADICDAISLRSIFNDFKPEAIMHLAAESHVDRSIDHPVEFIKTNILGTFHILEESKRYYESLSENVRKGFKFHHISTDEV